MKLRALVVDDSRIMRNMVKDTLLKSGIAEFDFSEAGDGGEAIGMFDPDLFDIVFLDWNMPNLNGLEFARHARSFRSARHIPVIMITSESAEEKRNTAQEEARITCYITKPFNVKIIKDRLTPIVADIAKRQAGAGVGAGAAATKQAGFFGKLAK